MEYFKEMALNGYWGYKQGTKPITVDASLLKLYQYLTSKDLNYSLRYSNSSLEDIIKSTKAFYSSYFTVQDILHVDDTRREIIYDKLMLSDMGIDTMIGTMNAFGLAMSPFELPVKPRMGGHLGALNEVIFLSGDFENAYKIPIAYNMIALEYPYTILTPCAYSHEIAHTQMGLHKGVNLTDYHNAEVMSIFIEKLHAYETDIELFRAIEKDRLQEVKYLIGSLYVPLESRRPDANMMSSFIVSSLIADNLFNMYAEASLAGKKLLLSYLNEVLEGKRNLEHLLADLEIDYERSKNPEYIEANLSL